MDDTLIRVLTRLLRVNDELGETAFERAANRALVAIARSVQTEANRKAGLNEPDLGESVVKFPPTRRARDRHRQSARPEDNKSLLIVTDGNRSLGLFAQHFQIIRRVLDGRQLMSRSDPARPAPGDLCREPEGHGSVDVRDYARIKRELEIERLRTFARIEEAEDGGPIIDLMTGREPHAVGQKTCIKAAMWALPWESAKAELPMIELCEVASPVKAMLSQPHELFMKVTGDPREWMYRPDLRLTADAAFVGAVLNGTPFWQAVVEWSPENRAGHDLTLIVEVKDDDDPRMDDPIYMRKLELARQVYESINWRFVTVVRSEDITEGSIAHTVRNLMLDHDVSLSPADINRVRDALGPAGRGALRDVATALGPGWGGIARCAALHVRRLISIDLRHDLKPDTPVIRMPDDMAIFEMNGRVLW